MTGIDRAATIVQRERPILFSGSMVRALLAGTKTQTRRIARLRPSDGRCASDCAGVEPDRAWADPGLGDGGYLKVPCRDGAAQRVYCPHGSIGDRMWVRETVAIETCRDIGWYEPPHRDGRPLREHRDADDGRWWEQPHYRATDPEPDLFYESHPAEPRVRWIPSTCMPRWASRITLAITDVRVQRLQDISEDDARAEGIPLSAGGTYYPPGQDGSDDAAPNPQSTAKSAYALLWESINGIGSWYANPWVWCIGFTRIPVTETRPATELDLPWRLA